MNALLHTTRGALALLALAAFLLGAPALVAAGLEAGVPSSLAWLVPVAVDLGIVLLGLASMAARGAGVTRWPIALGVAVLVVISAAVQIAHALGAGAGWLSAAVAALFPMLLWLSASTVERLTWAPEVAKAVAKRRPRPAAADPVVAGGRVAAVAKPRVAAKPGGRVAVIDPAVREAAVARVAGGESQRTVAAALGVSRAALQGWLRAEAS